MLECKILSHVCEVWIVVTVEIDAFLHQRVINNHFIRRLISEAQLVSLIFPTPSSRSLFMRQLRPIEPVQQHFSLTSLRNRMKASSHMAVVS